MIKFFGCVFFENEIVKLTHVEQLLLPDGASELVGKDGDPALFGPSALLQVDFDDDLADGLVPPAPRGPAHGNPGLLVKVRICFRHAGGYFHSSMGDKALK